MFDNIIDEIDGFANINDRPNGRYCWSVVNIIDRVNSANVCKVSAMRVPVEISKIWRQLNTSIVDFMHERVSPNQKVSLAKGTIDSE